MKKNPVKKKVVDKNPVKKRIAPKSLSAAKARFNGVKAPADEDKQPETIKVPVKKEKVEELHRGPQPPAIANRTHLLNLLIKISDEELKDLYQQVTGKHGAAELGEVIRTIMIRRKYGASEQETVQEG